MNLMDEEFIDCLLVPYQMGEIDKTELQFLCDLQSWNIKNPCYHNPLLDIKINLSEIDKEILFLRTELNNQILINN